LVDGQVSSVESEPNIEGPLIDETRMYVGSRVGLTGQHFDGLIAWLAWFEGLISEEARTELALWDGSIEDEPLWLRSRAALYLNANDPETILEYGQTGTVLNLSAGGNVPPDGSTVYPVLTPSPHNSVLLATAESGLVGGILLLVLIFFPAGLAFVRTRGRTPDPVFAGGISVLLAFIVQSASNNLFQIPTVVVYFWVVAASLVSVASADVRTQGASQAPSTATDRK
jgi:hypothetical protein